LDNGWGSQLPYPAPAQALPDVLLPRHGGPTRSLSSSSRGLAVTKPITELKGKAADATDHPIGPFVGLFQPGFLQVLAEPKPRFLKVNQEWEDPLHLRVFRIVLLVASH